MLRAISRYKPGPGQCCCESVLRKHNNWATTERNRCHFRTFLIVFLECEENHPSVAAPSQSVQFADAAKQVHMPA